MEKVEKRSETTRVERVGEESRGEQSRASVAMPGGVFIHHLREFSSRAAAEV